MAIKYLLIKRSKVETSINDLKEALKGEDVEDIKKKTGELTEASMKLGEVVYKDMQEQEQEKPKDQPKKEKKKMMTLLMLIMKK